MKGCHPQSALSDMWLVVHAGIRVMRNRNKSGCMCPEALVVTIERRVRLSGPGLVHRPGNRSITSSALTAVMCLAEMSTVWSR